MVFGGDGGFPMIALNLFSFGNCLQLVRGTNFRLDFRDYKCPLSKLLLFLLRSEL